MTQGPTVSVIVVSHGRPDDLARCLQGLQQLDYAPFEIVVVADEAGLKRVSAMGWAERVKTRRQAVANISQARNQGILAASGDILAFIDDDAVPEPTWLAALVAPFSADDVAAAGGFVRGRNGISFQWKARYIDEGGQAQPLDVDPGAVTVLKGRPGYAIKTEGTNMAFRRDVLAGLGGFDPAYHFYLDETDLNLRLAEHGARTAIVPLAEVHHGFAPSDRRRRDRVPQTLFDVGASTAVFQRRHGFGPEQRLICRENERKRLLRHMVAGRIEPRDVGRLLATLEQGFDAGAARSLGPLSPLGDAAEPFLEFRGFGAGATTALAGTPLKRAALDAEARALVAQGQRVSVFRFSHSALFHRTGFVEGGYWLQTGGVFGRSDRDQPLFSLWKLGRRVRQEIARVTPQRGISGPGDL